MYTLQLRKHKSRFEDPKGRYISHTLSCAVMASNANGIDLGGAKRDDRRASPLGLSRRAAQLLVLLGAPLILFLV